MSRIFQNLRDAAPWPLGLAEVLSGTGEGYASLGGGHPLNVASPLLFNRPEDAACATRLSRIFDTGHYTSVEIVVAQFHNATVDARLGHCITADGVLLEESVLVARMIDPTLGMPPAAGDGDALPVEPPEDLAEPVFHCFHRSTPAYGHFILDGLVVVQAVCGALTTGPLKLLMPAYMPGWAYDAVRALGIPDTQIVVGKQRDFRCRILVVASSINASTTFHPDPELCLALQQRFPRAGGLRRRLYLSRSNQNSYSQRSIVNEQEVQRLLVARGFEVLEPGNMTLDAQAIAFAEASVIAGAHGSAFGNLVFASRGAVVIDMMPIHWVGYWGESGGPERWLLSLTAALGLSYQVVLCTSEMVRVLPDEDQSGLQKFGMASTVDLELLEHALAAATSRQPEPHSNATTAYGRSF